MIVICNVKIIRIMKTVLSFIIIKANNLCDRWYNFKFHFLLWLNDVNSKDVHVCKGCPIIDIKKGASINWGKDIWLNNFHNTSWYSRCMIHVGADGCLTIGDHSGMNGALIYCDNSITIGSHVNVGGGTRVYDTNFHPTDWRARRGLEFNKTPMTAPIVIGDDVFIGTNCIIGKGVHIGDRSVIAAGSVVVKDIPADCIAGGNPCKVIRKL